ncbi:ATP-dependent DNA helicase srs2 [Taxawa tesnikishii (nom. ined.)]|nr:ATP-dependent DNA helicase srs2 [Dothideales sp. JES 119]
MDALLDGLNPAQREAVTSPASVLQCGIRPWDIIVCTFTVKAANEMKERIKAVVGEELGRKLVLGTFHSISRRYLVSYGKHIGIPEGFGIADTSDQKAVVNRIIKENHLGIQPNVALARISSLKSKSISCEEFATTNTKKDADQQEFAIVYAEYEQKLRAANLLDYDDLLLRCASLLRSHPHCVSNVQAVLIDEFQDTNNVQFDLMSLFAQHKNTITIVGDPDQSIYGWRNAEIKNLIRMQELYRDTLVIHLKENYRSAGAILQWAQKIIEQDQTRPSKSLQATHLPGERPVLRKLPTADAEARWLVAEIKRTQGLSGRLLRYGDFAILLRSASVSRHIESALGKEGIPYRMIGGTKFFDRVEVKLIIDYLRVINQPEHNDALLRIINVPPRSMGEKTIKTLYDEAADQAVPIWNVIKNFSQGRRKLKADIKPQAQKSISEFVDIILTAQKKKDKGGSDGSPDKLVEFVVAKTKLQNYLRTKYPEDHDTRWANVEELKAQTADLTAAIARGDDLLDDEALPEIDGLEQKALNADEDALTIFLANIALSSEKQQAPAEGEEGGAPQCVTISTIHAAKGLEWPVVFIPACYEGHIPHSRAEDNDEERRLLYVGMTRAQALLYLSCPTKNSQFQEATMSSFLTQPGVDKFYDKRGSTLPFWAIGNLAKTLRRECPAFELDDYWPEDGSAPLAESAKWDYGTAGGTEYVMSGSAFPMKRRRIGEERSISPTRPLAGFVSASTVTMQNEQDYSAHNVTLKTSGFGSAALRKQELEAREEEAKLKRIDKRGEERPKMQGRKVSKAAAGSGNILNFFGRKASEDQTSKSTADSVIFGKEESGAIREPMRDIKNTAPLPRQDTDPDDPDPLPASVPNPASRLHKPRTAPLLTHPTRGPPPLSMSRKRQDYVFLSSSPPPPETISTSTSDDAVNTDTKVVQDQAAVKQTPLSRPATTLHTTSMSMVGQRVPTVRRTLGMRRSLQGWSARGERVERNRERLVFTGYFRAWRFACWA